MLTLLILDLSFSRKTMEIVDNIDNTNKRDNKVANTYTDINT